jgi:RNA polymerase sigma factor (sigma-70 family)
VAVLAPERPADVVALDDALNLLAKADERKARVVELRYFGGLTVDEIAAVLDIAAVTVMRDWQYARAWLRRTLEHGS